MENKNIANKLVFSNRDFEHFIQVEDSRRNFIRKKDSDFPMVVYEINMSELEMHDVRWHWHEEAEILTVASGQVRFCVEKEEVLLKEGDSVFINQNTLHSIRSLSNTPSKVISTVFHTSFLIGFGSTSIAAKYITPITESLGIQYLLFPQKGDKQTSIAAHLHELNDIYKKKEYTYELLCKSILCNMWSRLILESAEELKSYIKPKRITNDEARIKQAIIYLEEHFCEQITLDDIANYVHISKSECCRCFKRFLNMSPFDFLNKYRIFYATKLLQRKENSDSNIADLAITVGFSNISYFNKVFKKHVGMTPSEYRKQQLEHPDENISSRVHPIRH